MMDVSEMSAGGSVFLVMQYALYVDKLSLIDGVSRVVDVLDRCIKL